MRIISQDRTFNIAYENANVCKVNTTNKYLITVTHETATVLPQERTIGFYSDCGRRDEVFNEIVTSGASGVKVYRMPVDREQE